MISYLYKVSSNFYSFARSYLSPDVAQKIRNELKNNYYLNGNRLFPVTSHKLFSELNQVLISQKKECYMQLLDPSIPDYVLSGDHFYLDIKFVGYEDDIFIPLRSHKFRVNVLETNKDKMIVDVKLVAVQN